MNYINTQLYDTPYGVLKLAEFEGKLCMCDWEHRKLRCAVDNRVAKGLKGVYRDQDGEVLEQTRQQLEEYFSRKRESFNLPLAMVGTDFQKQVWEALIKVPFGETFSYMKLAHSMGNEKAIRAVASANGANAISIIIPCHRIIGSKGELTGYAGGIPAKKKLLQLEASNDLFSGQL